MTGADEPAAKTKKVTAGALKLEIPETWEFKESTRQFREGEIKVPAVEGDKDAGEIVVFFFGQGGAGGVQANIDRWVGQFEEKGRTSKVTAGKTTQGDFTLVELSGTYKKPIGPPIAGQSKAMPGWRMLGAIVATDAGAYFVKFDGPDKTVTASARRSARLWGSSPTAKSQPRKRPNRNPVEDRNEAARRCFATPTGRFSFREFVAAFPHIVLPPSTTRHCPVVSVVPVAKYMIASAMSSGYAGR